MQLRRNYPLLFSMFVLVAVMFLSCPLRPTSTFKVIGSAMEPNFYDGQLVEVESVDPSYLSRGDVIIFEIVDNTYLKRLVGLPGETVEIRDGQVFINDVLLEEPYQVTRNSSNFPSREFGADEYFVLGDNRGNSSDSRVFGPVPADAIIGRVLP